MAEATTESSEEAALYTGVGGQRNVKPKTQHLTVVHPTLERYSKNEQYKIKPEVKHNFSY